MTARDWRAVLILPLIALCCFFVGSGLILPAVVVGVACGWCLGAKEEA